jgi:hypothetical protein
MAAGVSTLDPGRVYSWDDLAPIFGFQPGYFAVAGGMVPSRETGSLLLITHPGGGKSFDYNDYWDGADLIYTGRGKVGHQQRAGANLDVAENRRTLLVFEGAGPRQLLFLGYAQCTEARIGRGLDDNDVMRDVLLFRLTFAEGAGRSRSRSALADAGDHAAERRPRPFRRERPPPPPATPTEPARPEETAAKREQANERHHEILLSLDDNLVALGCSEIEEWPGAIDLWATCPDGARVIFEAKTLTGDNELTQTRSGFAQLHEYRVEYGKPDDVVCLVVDQPLTMRRQRLLDALGVAVLVIAGSDINAGNDGGSHLIDALTTEA